MEDLSENTIEFSHPANRRARGGGSLAVAPAPAFADPSTRTVPYTAVTFGNSKAAGVSTTVGEQLTRSRADRSRGAAAKADFLRRAAANGRFYDAGNVDYLRFDRADGIAADVVVPADYKIDTVQIGYGAQPGEEANSAAAEATGGEIEGLAQPMYPSGPGFETYNNVSGGSYQINVYYPKGPGKLYLNWSKYKDADTTHPQYEIWAYRRWAVATPSGNDLVKTMGMRSYPTAASQNVLKDWHDLSPLPGAYSGNCYSGGITIGITGLSYTFESCQSWRVDWNDLPWNAGDMSFNWSNDGIFMQGHAMHMAAIFAVRTFPGTTPYYKDFFKVKFYAAARECASTDSSVNCNM